MPKRADVSGVILAGGEGRRMGGQDKGWLQLQGLALVKRVLQRIEPQVVEVVISANRHLDEYALLERRVIRDETPYQGPLGGIVASLKQINTDYGLVVPTDAPLIPPNLTQMLAQHMPAKLILCSDETRLQPLFGLYHRSLADSIDEFLAKGERKLTQWCHQQEPVVVKISDNAIFTNLNTPEDLRQFVKTHPQ